MGNLLSFNQEETTNMIWFAHQGKYDKVLQCLENGANVNGTTLKNDYTALNFASTNGHTDVVRLLLSRGAKASLKDSYGSTALRGAVIFNNKDIVEMLLNGGANIEEKTPKGDTPLMIASSYGHVDLVAMLLHRGANINAMNEDRGTALCCALWKGRAKVIKILINWPVTMAILVLQELVVYHLLDIISYNDLFEFIGE
jgi:ankyrin repeat protein